ncbi:hypothetical protein [Spiroplasma taiwanense]|uniref:Uncharacterized protein n=1 Tax=Spiroplasma taiwanense CT-1 TaxID=1276220 RepID=S5MG23_9MOLU|nr:hypothetical protein [Spiroplasma taiwanense]AGR40820.1 hypothetical protein STAIW_v1c01340 [Spiroplasma taiwanense CT-1]
MGLKTKYNRFSRALYNFKKGNYRNPYLALALTKPEIVTIGDNFNDFELLKINDQQK